MADLMTQALAEAYASAPADEIIFHTIEMRHPSFDVPIRVVRDHAVLTATLESNAPANPGELVEFQAFAFDIQMPSINEQGAPQLTLTIDNVSREITAALEQAVVTPYLIEVTYRAFLASDTSQPQTLPVTLMIRSVSADMFKVTAQCGLRDLTKSAMPRRTYTLEDFPALASAS
jgi:hypothetical protein